MSIYQNSQMPVFAFLLRSVPIQPEGTGDGYSIMRFARVGLFTMLSSMGCRVVFLFAIFQSPPWPGLVHVSPHCHCMGVHRVARCPSRVKARLFVLFGALILLAVFGFSDSSPSRRQVIRRMMADSRSIDTAKTYRIGVKHMPPMCFYDPTLPEDQRFSGFYIDFWKQMNEELLVNYTFHLYQNNLEVVEALKTDEIDIGLGLSITWKRALEVDFTQPIVDGSLRIMTKSRTGLNIWEMFMPFHWSLWVTILLVAVINGHIIWLVERDSNSYYFPKFYFSGVREGLWFSFMNLMMMDDAVVRSFPGKLVKFGNTFIGVILIAIYTATVASVLTTGDMGNRVMGPQDLIGRKVGSNYGSTAADYVTNYGGMQLVLYASGKDAFFALKDGKVPAVVLDYPVLVYYSRQYSEPGLTIVDSILEYDFIGLAMRQNSSLIPTLNGVIVGLTQTGYSSQLSSKWIGEPKRSVTQAYDVFDTVGLWIWMIFWAVFGVLAFILKKYVIKKSYKHAQWYSAWGGDENAVKKEDYEDVKSMLPFGGDWEKLDEAADGSETESDHRPRYNERPADADLSSSLGSRRAGSSKSPTGDLGTTKLRQQQIEQKIKLRTEMQQKKRRDSTYEALATYSDGEEESDSAETGLTFRTPAINAVNEEEEM